MEPQKPIISAVKQLQKGRRSRRDAFLNELKSKYPNLHVLYVFINIITIWSGFFLIADAYVYKRNLLIEPTPAFSLEVTLRHLSLLILGMLLLLLDDLSLKELLFGTKTRLEKHPQDMNFREKLFDNFKTRYPNLSTIYSLIGIVLCWAGLWGAIMDLPIQPLWRSLLSPIIGFLLLYLDDLSLDEL